MQNAECRMKLYGYYPIAKFKQLSWSRPYAAHTGATHTGGLSSMLYTKIFHFIPRWPLIRVVLPRCYNRRFFTSYPDGIIWLSSNHQISTTIVENLGSWPLNSFGSIVPSVIKTFPKQMFALGKEPLENFPFRKPKKGSALFALPFGGSAINW